jgi:hypothetical protein
MISLEQCPSCVQENQETEKTTCLATFMILTIAKKTGDTSSLLGETSRQLAPQI